MAIYRDLEVLFNNSETVNDLSGKYELVMLVPADSETAQALSKVAKVNEKDGDGMLRIRAKSNYPISVWKDHKKVSGSKLERGTIIDIDAKLVDWEWKNKKGTSLWINAANIMKEAEHKGFDADRDPFEADDNFAY